MKVFARGVRKPYQAKGDFENGKLTVLKGSIISSTEEEKLSATIRALRADKNLVSPKMVVLKDIEFNTASAAANFVTGNNANGMRVWHDERGNHLTTVLASQEEN